MERTTNLTASPVADAVVGDRDDEGEHERLGDEMRSMWKSMGSHKREEVWPDGRRSGPATRTRIMEPCSETSKASRNRRSRRSTPPVGGDVEDEFVAYVCSRIDSSRRDGEDDNANRRDAAAWRRVLRNGSARRTLWRWFSVVSELFLKPLFVYVLAWRKGKKYKGENDGEEGMMRVVVLKADQGEWLACRSSRILHDSSRSTRKMLRCWTEGS